MPIRIGVSYIDSPDAGRNYLEAIKAVGAEPVVLATAETCPEWPTEEQAKELFDPSYPGIQRVREVDGLLLTGGGDVDPMLFREAMRGSHIPHWSRDHVEMAQLHLARERGLPILGICRGVQFLNVALGGALVQHLTSAVRHASDPENRQSRAHLVRVAAESRLAHIFADDPTEDLVVGVNSRHHQGISPDRLARLLVASAHSSLPEDAEVGVVEALETPETRAGEEFVLGVQWHPERFADAGAVQTALGPARGVAGDFAEMSLRLFRAFAAAARRTR